MKQRRKLELAAIVTAAIAVVGVGEAGSQAGRGRAASAQAAQAPMFQVDPMWPQPLGDNKILGSAVGVTVDPRGHVFVLNLRNSFNTGTEIGAAANPPTGECCIPAPDVLEFDSTGVTLRGWGGPGTGYQWPVTPQRITVDPRGNLWMGGVGPTDTHILKFGADGRIVAQYGKVTPTPEAPPGAAGGGRGGGGGGRGRGAAADSGAGGGGARGARGGGRGGADSAGARGAGRGGGGGGGGGGRGGPVGVPAASNATDAFGGAAKISIDAAANEGYVADGYRNRRVAVIDLNTGAIKRHWGAYGERPNDSVTLAAYDPAAPPVRHFRTVTCAEPSTDGFVYVCDRGNNRIQVFRKNGTFVSEKVIMPNTRAEGSVWDIAFSRDPQQRFLYVADGRNMKIHILDRQSLEVLTAFGDGGRYPGQFLAVHSIATDARGNIYTTETSQGKRVQKFVFKGLGPVTKANQGVVWPPKGGE